MAFIEPLALETWFINVFAGSRDYFAPLALFMIISMAAYLRMTGLTMGLMIMVFLMMFSGFITPSLLVFVAIVGGLVLGYTLAKIVKN